jgi:predicted RNA binding protein YcfA (HicA-like mRNA interferase family)
MPELPLISGDECMAALMHVGYYVARSRGSHFRLRCEGRRPVTVPRHGEFDRATLRSILRQAELSVDEFLRLLER